MTNSPLSIAFLWHMHQPFYKDPLTQSYRLPWVRLHGTKDYLDMLTILEDFPDIKQTFNFTPSLLEQLLDYTENHATDRYLALTLKRASDLDQDEKIFLLENFFLANWDTMIKPFPRYYELLRKRGLYLIRSELARYTAYFQAGDFLDLQVLFNLSWIDPLFRNADPFLSALVSKGRDFTEEEKTILIEKQYTLLKEIIPKYASMANTQQIELSVSPFYHPILPLLCDTNAAKRALPDIRLPQKRFSHPEDAEKQIKMGIDYFEKLFGYHPIGMWPSEGSVSEDVMRLIARTGIQWIATDEDILSLSLGKPLRDPARNMISPNLLYRPYAYEGVSIIFRDHSLSDLIGFAYSKWDAKKAADDLISRFIQVWQSVPKDKPCLLSIILDGENAWEYYHNDGYDFLKYLYEGLSHDERLKTVTVSEYLNENGRGEQLNMLHAGSWIYANYAVWIGHDEDNLAWDHLSDARNELEMFQGMNPEKDLSAAWKSIYIAEGSDWNWWYGDDHSTELQKDFDELYRTNLMKVYQEMGKEIPPQLFIPISREDRWIPPSVMIRGFIDPKIDGIVTSYFEWYQAARMDIRVAGGSMHKSEGILSALYYGFNRDTLFLRLDISTPFNELPDDTLLSVNFIKPAFLKFMVTLKPSLKAELLKRQNETWLQIKDITDVAVQDILEAGLPFTDLEAGEQDEISFSVMMTKNGGEIERYPWRGYITLTAPNPDFEAMMWQ